MTDIVRVLRLLEYTGPRHVVEKQITKAIQGVRVFTNARGEATAVTAATIGTFAHVLDPETQVAALHDALRRSQEMSSLRDVCVGDDDLGGHAYSSSCPCKPFVNPPYRIHRPFSDPPSDAVSFDGTRA